MNAIQSRFEDLFRSSQNIAWASWLARLPMVANVVMVLLLANVLAVLSWKLIPLPETPEAPTTTASVSSVGQGRPQPSASYGQIANWHLFGEISKTPVKAVTKTPEVVPDTTLRLTLKGVIATSDMLSAFAIIADASGKEQTYRVGDQVPGGAELKEVYADRVILLRSNRHETLRLPENKLSQSNNISRNQVNRRSSSRRMASTNTNTVSPQAAAILQDYRQKLINDPQSLMNVVRAEPYRRGGKLAGYRVFPGQDKELLDRVGLQPGDVITSVNGIEMDSPIKGLEVMKSITEGGPLSVDVLRNGVSQTYVVPIN